MKIWNQPKLRVLFIQDTLEFNSEECHCCHAQSGENCSDFTNGLHGSNGHTTPEWCDEHWHTCCCIGTETVPES